MAEPTPDFAATIEHLPPKDKQPASARILNDWITRADNSIVPGGTSGRLRWLVASAVVTAALQRAVDADGRALFLLKGGTLLQYRLGLATRATADLDGLVRGDLDEFLDRVDTAYAEPWGPLDLRRGASQVINIPARRVKPRRFDTAVSIRGKPWARVQVEISPDEAGAGGEFEPIPAPRLSVFGLPDPTRLVGLAMRFQIAQELHASTDPHQPPLHINDRSRDLVDLVLLRDMASRTGAPSLSQLCEAGEALFAARAAEAAAVGMPARTWPPRIVAYPDWRLGYQTAADQTGVALTIDQAAATINKWIEQIANA